jgi:hypothetical protein
MLRITVSRIRIFIAALGCAILSASLFDWAQNLRATEAGYAWVKADSPTAPAVETAEIWQVSASCVRPFFVNAVLQSKVRLNNHYALAPADVRTWRTQPVGANLQPAAGQSGGLYRLVSHERDGEQNSAATEHVAMLHARYAEWYANLFKLEIQEHEWEQRLSNVADQSVTVSEATRRTFGAYGGRDIGRVSAHGDFDHYLLVLLGLGGFPGDQEQALRADCVKLIPVKEIFKSPSYLGEIWRWPVDHAAAFSFGLELVLIGIFFIPIDLWIGTGDFRAVGRHLGDAVRRLMTKVRNLPRSKPAASISGIARATLVGARTILTARTNPGRAVGELRFVSKLAEIRFSHYLSRLPALIADKRIPSRSIEWLKHAGGNRFDDRFA